MADTRNSKLFIPLPAYQQRIIEELCIPNEKSSLKEVIKREKIYIQKMIAEKRRIEGKIEETMKTVKRTIVFDDSHDDSKEFGQIKTFKLFKEFILEQQSKNKSSYDP